MGLSGILSIFGNPIETNRLAIRHVWKCLKTIQTIVLEDQFHIEDPNKESKSGTSQEYNDWQWSMTYCWYFDFVLQRGTGMCEFKPQLINLSHIPIISSTYANGTKYANWYQYLSCTSEEWMQTHFRGWFDRALTPVLFALCKDPVPNVRLNAAKIIPQFSGYRDVGFFVLSVCSYYYVYTVCVCVSLCVCVVFSHLGAHTADRGFNFV